MNRERIVNQIKSNPNFDVVIIGGGATGLGCALDATSRGFRTLVIEQSDFGKGTSSKSTKLIHGGVRYLENGDVKLVYEALKERALLLKNAPHLVFPLKIVIPNYSYFTGPYYAAGMKMYDLLAWHNNIGPSEWLDYDETLETFSNLKLENLKSGITYYDGQFNDTRYLVSLLRTIQNHSGVAINYIKCTNLRKDKKGNIIGLYLQDQETKDSILVNSKMIINATGAYSKEVLGFDKNTKTQSILPSQGTHIVVPKAFLPEENGMLIPKTRDGRVLFVLPWMDHVLIGTTDIVVTDIRLDPVPLKEEVDFILETAARYLAKAPKRKDILSVFSGIRPLALEDNDNVSSKDVSRSHKIQVSDSGLITISGGKWTTYRKMAEDTIDKMVEINNLVTHDCITENIKLQGYQIEQGKRTNRTSYGTDWANIIDLMKENKAWASRICEGLPFTEAEVIWACRKEMAITVEDILARRTRSLFLNAQSAINAAPKVAKLMQIELKKSDEWRVQQVSLFNKLAESYLA